MTNTEMQKLGIGDVVKFQRDEDPELETGVVLKVGSRQTLLAGIDELSGFWHRAKAEDIFEVVKSHSLEGPDRDRIERALENIDNSVKTIKQSI